MSAWGTGIKQSDEFMDVYDEFFDTYKDGASAEEVYKAILESKIISICKYYIRYMSINIFYFDSFFKINIIFTVIRIFCS